jgi:hypothetical protein
MKTRTPKKRYNSKVCYALIITLRGPEDDVDLHAEIDTAIKLCIAQDVEV